MDILIVTSRPEQWAPVLPVMEGRGAAVRQAGSLEQGMELVRQQAPALAVLDLGLEPEELRKAVTLVCQKANVVACDVNELSPPYDQSGVSTMVACKVVREMLLALN